LKCLSASRMRQTKLNRAIRWLHCHNLDFSAVRLANAFNYKSAYVLFCAKYWRNRICICICPKMYFEAISFNHISGQRGVIMIDFAGKSLALSYGQFDWFYRFANCQVELHGLNFSIKFNCKVSYERLLKCNPREILLPKCMLL